MEYKTKAIPELIKRSRASILEKYLAEANHLEARVSEFTKAYSRISWLRLFWIVASAITIYYLFNAHILAGIVGIIIAISLFLILVTRHLNVAAQKSFFEKLQSVNQTEIDYFHGNFTLAKNGINFLREDHPYALDLDLFGPKSLFHYCNRTQTDTGAAKLADALSHPTDHATISSRQFAAGELSEQFQWRQSFLAKTKTKQSNFRDFELIRKWATSPNLFSHRKWLNIMRFIVPIITIILMVVVVLYLPLSSIIFVLMIPGYFLMKHAKQVSQIQTETEHSFSLLLDYADLIKHIELHSFKTESLQKLQKKFQNDHIDASSAIKQLSYYIRQLNVRLNPFAILLNIFGMWDFHWVFALEKWKEKHKNDLDNWIEALGEMDFLISIANITYNHPDWNFPTIIEDETIEAIQIGHPLIFNKKVIKNYVRMPLRSKIRLITGSNMAGKSTFLRSMGINMVLAYAGFPVLAKSFKLPIMHVFTSMRTKDNIHESTSSFYAELKRLRAAIESVKKNQSTFFLLDEILKGTNSVDRHTGSRALIKQLLKLDGTGIIATHDLELAILEEETNGKMENWCFDVEIVEGELNFDYLIKRGVCSSFNATHLMREMGFDLNEAKN
jgi:DNA mismatch repair ATPase MutS